jgi:catechol 2,3-dioxygenase-like lactoylglutathione lyase family enzyme/cold shock CspA family protein
VEPLRAVVRVWHDDEGWGVLDSPATPGGCWTHFSALDAAGYRSAQAGQGALLTAEPARQDGYAWRAVHVLLDGVPPAPAATADAGTADMRTADARSAGAATADGSPAWVRWEPAEQPPAAARPDLPGPEDPSAFVLRPLHHVQLAVPPGSEERCRAFWGGVLGMVELDKPPALAARGGCWFRGGDLEVHLGVEDPFAPARKAHPGILVDGLRALAARLEAGGHPVAWDDAFPGHDRFYAADPFGNRLEFLQPEA